MDYATTVVIDYTSARSNSCAPSAGDFCCRFVISSALENLLKSDFPIWETIGLGPPLRSAGGGLIVRRGSFLSDTASVRED